MGQGNNASWPVGGATRQSGGNWVGRFEKPEDWNIWASMYSSNLELGQLITVGDSILKWTAAGVKFVDAAFATQADLDSFCSKIGTPIAPGSTATVAGVEKQWNDSYWIAPAALGGGIVYDGVTYPLPLTAPYKGYKIAVVNPAVPDGWSTLKWTGMGWAPPAGELIAATPPGLTTALVTPGVTTLTQIWASQVIPDYMTPPNLEMEISGNIGVKNSAGVAGCIVGCGICGGTPSGASAFNYPISASVTPASAFYNGAGSGVVGRRALIFRGAASFQHPDPVSSTGGISKDSGIMGGAVSGENRLYAMAKPSSPSDQVRFDGAQVWSKGNL